MGSILVMLLLLGLLGCSVKNVGTFEAPTREVARFGLNVLDSSFIDGSSAGSFDLIAEDYENNVVVSVKANGAVDMKALYLEMTYDPNEYRPMTVIATEAMGAEDSLLTLRYFKDPGTVHYGQVLANYEWRTGFSGDGVLAQVQFRREPALNLRDVSKVCTAPGAAAIATLNGNNLDWLYGTIGDYDQNSETGIADLTPLGANFLTVGPFAEDSAEVIIDGDNNGEINIADITPIGANFLDSTAGGYNVYEGAVAGDYPNGGTLLGNVAFADATGGYPTSRKSFTYDVTAVAANGYMWVRASDGLTPENLGTPSELIQKIAPADQPVLSLPGGGLSGTGTQLDPFYVDVTTDYVFQLIHWDGMTDVSTSVDTTYTVSDPAVGTISEADATLNIEDAYGTAGGDFNVTAEHDGRNARVEPDNRAAIYFHVEGPGPGGDEIVIFADDAHPTLGGNWGAPVTGSGTEADPYVLDEGDYTKQYPLRAEDDEGTAIANSAVSWDAVPPFIVTWPDPVGAAGVFEANLFTSNYVFGQRNDNSNNSPGLYIVIQSLPE